MVARAGALVSPALISPPRPLDLLRDRVPLSFVLGVLERLLGLGPVDGARRGKASVAGIVRIEEGSGVGVRWRAADVQRGTGDHSRGGRERW